MAAGRVLPHPSRSNGVAAGDRSWAGKASWPGRHGWGLGSNRILLAPSSTTAPAPPGGNRRCLVLFVARSGPELRMVGGMPGACRTISREHSSAGSEHLPYKQRVIGSNPIAPTETLRRWPRVFFVACGWFSASRHRREGHWFGSDRSHIGGSFYFRAPQRDLSSAGSERMLHTHEVTGSNPVGPTKPRDRGAFSWWVGAGSERPAHGREGHWSDPVGPTKPRDRGAGSSGSSVDRGVDRWLYRPASARDQSTSATTNTLPVTSTRSSVAAAARAAWNASRTEGYARPCKPRSAAARASCSAGRPRGMSALQKW